MEEHKRRGDRIVAYAEATDRRTEIEAGLFLKEQRVNFWKTYHKVPTLSDLDLRVYEVET